MTAKNIRFTDLTGFIVGIGLGLLVLMMLTGCSNAPLWGSWSMSPAKAEIQTVLHRLDTYIYFSNYQIYHHPGRGEYVFWDGHAWVTSQEAPQEVSAQLLEASPAVSLEFSDHPANHHAEVVVRYPRDWQSPDSFIVSNP